MKTVHSAGRQLYENDVCVKVEDTSKSAKTKTNIYMYSWYSSSGEATGEFFSPLGKLANRAIYFAFVNFFLF